MDTTDTTSIDCADVERLVMGHDAALNDLMERHGQRIFGFLLRMLGNEEDANDLAQETFLRVYQHRATFKAGANFSSWLYTIAGNLARNHYRWRSRHPNVSLDAEREVSGQSLKDTIPSTAAVPSEEALALERAQAVRAAVQCLPEDMREAILLCEWEDFSMADAAAALGTTVKAVESRLYRARIQLRQSLKKWL